MQPQFFKHIFVCVWLYSYVTMKVNKRIMIFGKNDFNTIYYFMFNLFFSFFFSVSTY